LNEISDQKFLIDIINRLLKEIATNFYVAERELHITASIGVSVYPKDGKTPEELLRNADLAMYIAKRDGRNKFQFYEHNLNEESLLKLEKESALRRAIDNQEFVLYYQPQIDTNSRKMIGVEALLRWQHPSQGLISPIEFLEVAEDSGLIVEIGKWVFKTACQQACNWHQAGAKQLRVAINVSNRQINDNNFIQMLDEVLAETKVDPKLIQLEITEETVINNERVVNVINEISKRGIRVAFDDFGTGNSSLNYLRMVPIDQLKIDRSFIKNINHNKNDEVIIRAILSIANDLELDVIAEGVETNDQLQFLSKYNCHEIQGYYFSKPLAAEDVSVLILNDKAT
jgi:EAL domain-containing protein (putative c-di-GMP-specific phosphodiesterase class I)